MKTIENPPARQISRCLCIPVGNVNLMADLHVPVDSKSLVILAYEFGGSRNHPRTRKVAQIMRNRGLATLLCDLLTDDEEARDEVTGNFHNDVPFLAKRLMAVTKWAASSDDTGSFRISYFGASAGGAAAIVAAAELPGVVTAVISRNGRLDLASESISRVKCPVLLLAGEEDVAGLDMNRQALVHMACPMELRVIPGASRLFAEPGTHEQMAELSASWLLRIAEG